MKITLDSKVSIMLSMGIKEDEGEVEIQSPSKIDFIYGRERLHPALEKALLGREKDDTIEIDIPPEQAFGEYNPELINEVPISSLRHPEAIREGAFYQETGKYGPPVRFMVKEVHDDYVVADFNHPAAGKTVTLNAKVLDIQQASIIEIMSSMKAYRGAGGG